MCIHQVKTMVCVCILCSSLGPVFALLPHSLHRQMAKLAAGQSAVSHVSAGVEVQRMTFDFRLRIFDILSASMDCSEGD